MQRSPTHISSISEPYNIIINDDTIVAIIDWEHVDLFLIIGKILEQSIIEDIQMSRKIF